ncbi:MAG TPA: hypothetical protein EYG71_01510 [Leucothrix sp.]|nr:hypothetical protein [Leucothrix sp.]
MKFFHSIFVILIIIATAFGVNKTIQNLKQDAIQQASENLQLTRDIRIAQLNSEVKTIYSEIRFWAESKPVVEGMSNILNGWYELSIDPKADAKKLYITNNPLYPNYTADYFNAGDDSLYSYFHEKMHKLLRGLTKVRGYYDVFLIANDGDILYSVYKEDDYATNLLTGKYKDTTLSLGFQEVHESTNLNHVSLFDFIPYAPSNNVPSSFIQTSIVDNNNKTQGVLAFQLPTESINAILKSIKGKNKNISIMAIGSNHSLRNQIDDEINKDNIQSTAIDKALKGEDGVIQHIDSKGNNVITAYAPFNFSQNILGSTNTNTWAIIVKQDRAEILKPVEEYINKWLSLLLGLTLLSLLLAWLFTRGKEDLAIVEEEEENIKDVN